MEFIGKDGKVIDTKGVDEATIGVIGKILEGAISRVTSGVKTQVAEAVAAAVDEHVKPIADKVGEIEKRPSPKPEGKPGETPDLAEAIAAALKPISESIESLKTDREREKTARTSREVAEQFGKEHFPSLKGREHVIARIAAANPAKPEDCQAVFDAWKSEQAAYGRDVEKLLGASPEGEGAEKPDPDKEKQDKADKIADIKRRGAA